MIEHIHMHSYSGEGAALPYNRITKTYANMEIENFPQADTTVIMSVSQNHLLLLNAAGVSMMRSHSRVSVHLLEVSLCVPVTQLCQTLCDPIAHQAPLSTEFSRPEYWSGSPFPPAGDLTDPGNPEDLPDQGMEPRSPALQADSFYCLSHQGSHRCVPTTKENRDSTVRKPPDTTRIINNSRTIVLIGSNWFQDPPP